MNFLDAMEVLKKGGYVIRRGSYKLTTNECDVFGLGDAGYYFASCGLRDGYTTERGREIGGPRTYPARWGYVAVDAGFGERDYLATDWVEVKPPKLLKQELRTCWAR